VQALVIQDRFRALLMGIEVNNRQYLREVIPWQPEPRAYPCIMYTYRPHDQVTGQGARALGLETGVPEFTYSWVWEYFGGLQAGEGAAQESFLRFDFELARALHEDPILGGACYGTSLRPRTDPGFRLDQNNRYFYVPMEFSATAEEAF